MRVSLSMSVVAKWRDTKGPQGWFRSFAHKLRGGRIRVWTWGAFTDGALRARPVVVRIHRYAGLLLAGFLILSGVTGSALVFHAEIDRYLNREWFEAKTDAPMLPLSVLVARAETRYPGAYVNRITLPTARGETVRLMLATKPMARAGTALEANQLDANQLYVDGATGKIVGAREWGALRVDRAHVVPFIYELHHRLHLGQWGAWILGVVACIWALDSLVGAYLAWPRSTWRAVRSALGVRWRAGTSRRDFDLHRASGLWFLPVLLALAVSGVYFNLGQEVFRPLLSLLSTPTPPVEQGLPRRPDPTEAPALDWDAALARAADTMPNARVRELRYEPSKAVYRIGFHTKADISARHPGAWVHVSGDTGNVLAVRRPNIGNVADIVEQWQFPLHSGHALGLFGRLLVLTSGLAVSLLAITGILIWRRKRLARRLASQRLSQTTRS